MDFYSVRFAIRLIDCIFQLDQIVSETRDIFAMSTSIQLNRLADEKGYVYAY